MPSRAARNTPAASTMAHVNPVELPPPPAAGTVRAKGTCPEEHAGLPQSPRPSITTVVPTTPEEGSTFGVGAAWARAMAAPSDEPEASRARPMTPTTKALPATRTSKPSVGSPGLAYGSSLRAVAQALDPDLASVVAAVPGWSGLEPRVVPLGGGITNRSFRVDIAGQSFVVRLSGKDTELLGIDRAAEHEAAMAAATAGVAPEVVAYLPELRALVTRFVEADPMPSEDLERREGLEQGVGAVKSIPPRASSQ